MSDRVEVVDSTAGLGDTEYSLADGSGMLKFDKQAMDECCNKINQHDILTNRIKVLEGALIMCSGVIGLPEYFEDNQLSELWEAVKQALEADNG